MVDKLFTVYILESITTGKKYIGHTKDINDRIKRHNQNREKSTRLRGPYRLIHTEKFYSRKDAVKRERYLKSLKGNLSHIFVG